MESEQELSRTLLIFASEIYALALAKNSDFRKPAEKAETAIKSILDRETKKELEHVKNLVKTEAPETVCLYIDTIISTQNLIRLTKKEADND